MHNQFRALLAVILTLYPLAVSAGTASTKQQRRSRPASRAERFGVFFGSANRDRVSRRGVL